MNYQPHPNQPQPYPYPYYPPMPTSGLAVAALILGILWVFWLGSLLAIIFGHAALSEIKRSPRQGQGMAVAGLVLGYIGAFTFVMMLVGTAAGAS